MLSRLWAAILAAFAYRSGTSAGAVTQRNADIGSANIVAQKIRRAEDGAPADGDSLDARLRDTSRPL